MILSYPSLCVLSFIFQNAFLYYGNERSNRAERVNLKHLSVLTSECIAYIQLFLFIADSYTRVY